MEDGNENPHRMKSPKSLVLNFLRIWYGENHLY